MAEKSRQFDADAASALLALAATESTPKGHCPTAEEIAAWQAKALTGDEAARMDAHVPHCQRCLTLWTGLLEATGTLEAARYRRASEWFGLSWLWQRPALVASAVVAIGASAVLLQQPFTGVPLAAYELQIDDRMIQRGSVASSQDFVVRYGPGDQFTLTLRPESAIEEPVEVNAYFDNGAGAMPLTLPAPRIAATGAVQIAGTVGDNVQLPAGDWAMYIVVGRKGELPKADRVVDALGDNLQVDERDWSAWKLALQVQLATVP